MAEQPDAEERTESASAKRLEEARQSGEVPRSRDLSSAAVMLFSCLALSMFGNSIVSGFAELMRSGLSVKFDPSMDTKAMLPAFGSAAFTGFMTVLPVLLAGLIAAIVAPMILSGWNFSTEALIPKFSRLNPLSGLQRIVSSQGLIELSKSILKVSLVGFIAVKVLTSDANELLAMGNYTLSSAMLSAAHLFLNALMFLAFGMLLLAAIDVPIQLWQYFKQMRMTREELKKEMKESEGSPEVKGKIRRLQQEMARSRMMSDVPTADVIVTNPTHFSVALRYDDKRNRAPIVVAKGVDLVAARIREIANENKVPIFEAPPLARVLYRSVDIGQEIPTSLYTAVAQVLTYIFQLRAFNKGEAIYPDRPVVDVKE